jgi:hypothetical protein
LVLSGAVSVLINSVNWAALFSASILAYLSLISSKDFCLFSSIFFNSSVYSFWLTAFFDNDSFSAVTSASYFSFAFCISNVTASKKFLSNSSSICFLRAAYSLFAFSKSSSAFDLEYLPVFLLLLFPKFVEGSTPNILSVLSVSIASIAFW